VLRKCLQVPTKGKIIINQASHASCIDSHTVVRRSSTSVGALGDDGRRGATSKNKATSAHWWGEVQLSIARPLASDASVHVSLLSRLLRHTRQQSKRNAQSATSQQHVSTVASMIYLWYFLSDGKSAASSALEYVKLTHYSRVPITHYHWEIRSVGG
jgi:hypothetical protein